MYWMLNYRFGLCFGDTSSSRDLAKIGREKQSICISVRCFIIYHHRIYLYIFYSVMLTYWIPSLPNKYFTSLLLKRSFILPTYMYVCISLAVLLFRMGWIGGRGSSFGWWWYKTYRQSRSWLLKKISMLWFIYLFFYKLYNTNISLALQQNYFYNKVMFFHWKKNYNVFCMSTKF